MPNSPAPRKTTIRRVTVGLTQTITVPADQLWEVTGLVCQFITDGAIGVRVLRIQFPVTGTATGTIGGLVVQPVNTTNTYSYSSKVRESSPVQESVSLPMPVVALGPGESLTLDTLGMPSAGDTFDTRITVRKHAA